MGKQKIVFFITIIIIAFSGCEKDDICIDADTPQLVVQFFDVDDRDELKEVLGLEIRGLEGGSLRDIVTLAATESTLLPLRTNATNTSFVLKRRITNTNINSDTINFTYSVTENFASRACGYVANYENLAAELTIDEPDSLWIQEITVESLTIENTEITHVKIFH